MMKKLLDRGQALASDAQQRKLAEGAGQLRAMFGNAVEIEGDRVLVSGRGIMKRWLIDPSLRFLGGLK